MAAGESDSKEDAARAYSAKWSLSRHNPDLGLLDVDNEEPSPEQHNHIRANGAWIPSYGERYRSGEVI